MIDGDGEIRNSVAAKPVIVPEPITVDRGKVYVGSTFLNACERLQSHSGCSGLDRIVLGFFVVVEFGQQVVQVGGGGVDGWRRAQLVQNFSPDTRPVHCHGYEPTNSPIRNTDATRGRAATYPAIKRPHR
jgi:hypothetical protein